MHIPHRIGLSALALALTLTLFGCDKQAGDVAAKVNGKAIGVAALELELKKLGQLNPAQHKLAAGQVLKNMVDQSLLAEQAVAEKLDKDTEVQLALDAVRRQVLAQAYVDKLTAKVAPPSEQEIADYFAKHPELFSARRIYRLQEISVPITPENSEAVQAQLAASKNLNDFIEWLKAQNIPARVSQSTKAAEQLPSELLPRLAQMQDGQVMTIKAPNSLNILVLAGAQPQPVTLEQAKASITRFLTNTKKRETAAAALKDLRAKAKVEYLGEYASLSKDQAAAPAPAAPGAEAAPATAEASAPAAK